MTTSNKEELLNWMNRRMRQMLVHSFIYYQMNTSIIEDKTFDRWAYELADAIKKHPEIAEQTPFYKDFKDFDGTTGYHLNFGDPDIQNAGLRLLKIHESLEKQDSLPK